MLAQDFSEFSRDLTEYAPVGIFVVGQRVLKFINPWFIKHTGYEMAELLGSDSLALVLSEDRAMVRQKNVERLKGVTSEPYEFRVRTKNGEVRWVMATVTPIKHDDEQMLLGFYIDVTAQKHLIEETYRVNKELTLLSQLSHLLAQPGDYPKTATVVLERLAEVAQADLVTLRAPSHEEKGLSLVAVVGSISSEIGEMIPNGTGLAGRVFELGQPIVANNYAQQPHANPLALRQGMQSALGLPIKVGERPIAVLTILSKRLNHFTPELVDFLSSVGDGLGVLLEHARLYHELEQGHQELQQRMQEIGSLNKLLQQHIQER